MRHSLRLFVALCLIACACSCKPQLSAAARAAQAARPHPDYARGRWRVASFDEIERTVLWTSHILIRHAAVNHELSPLRPFDWNPDGPASTRSDADARALAERVADLGRAHPENFAQLAAQYSEDAITRGRGGSLGGRSAAALPSRFLDAIEVMVPGETSQVVSSALGYHVFLWRNPPPDVRVAGRRIVIRYRGTLGRGNVSRSRDEARALAERILTQAKSDTPFEALVARYSEGDDRVLGGDVGTWSTREPSNEPALIEALADVPIGGVLDSLCESNLGFSIAQRTAASERTWLGAELEVFGFDPADATAERDAAKHTRDLIAEKQHAPDAISHIPVQRVIDGHFEPTLTAALRRLATGEITPEPVAFDGGYAVMRRVAVDGAWPEPPLYYDLPKPRVASLTLLDNFVRTSRPAQLADSLTQVQDLVSGLLSDAEKPRVDAIWRDLAAAFMLADTSDKRSLAYSAALGALHRTLSEARYAQLTGVLQRWVSGALTELDRP